MLCLIVDILARLDISIAFRPVSLPDIRLFPLDYTVGINVGDSGEISLQIRSKPPSCAKYSEPQDRALALHSIEDACIVNRHVLFRYDFDGLLCHHAARQGSYIV